MNSCKVEKVVYDILIKYQGLLVILVLIDQLTKIWALNSLDKPINILGIEWLQFKFIFNHHKLLVNIYSNILFNISLAWMSEFFIK